MAGFKKTFEGRWDVERIIPATQNNRFIKKEGL